VLKWFPSTRQKNSGTRIRNLKHLNTMSAQCAAGISAGGMGGGKK